jgi:Tol biopolymer transport system component
MSGVPAVAVDSIAWLADDQLLVAGYAESPKATGQNAVFLVYDVVGQSFSPLVDGGGVPLRGVSISASHDGAKIAFVTYSDHKTNRYGLVTAKERLMVLDRASGTATELGTDTADFDVNARAFDEPLISPKGQAIIYRRAGSDVGTSYTVIGVDGTILMPAREALMPAGYAWDPAGTKVVFTGQPVSAASGSSPVVFWLFDTETGGAAHAIARYKDTNVQDLSWSPDGGTIAWAEYDRKMDWRTGNVFLMPAAGGNSTALAKQALSPVWAPKAAGSLQTSPSP